MATKEVLSYSAMWNLKESRGAIAVEIEKGKFKTVDLKDPNEVLLCLDMLRNEKPVYFDDKDLYLRLGKEPVGTWDSQK